MPESSPLLGKKFETASGGSNANAPEQFERRVEQKFEQSSASRKEIPDSAPVATPAAPIEDSVGTTVASRDPEIKAIENILAEGLEGFFMALKPAQQYEFKRLGETAAIKIKATLHKGGYKIKDIVRLIADWLKTLPGMNKFFLEQEAKIKADKIVRQRQE